MKLAIIGSRGYPSSYGGYETLVRHLAPYLKDQGHEVTVYCRSGRPRRQRTVDGVRCLYTVGVDSKSVSTLSFGASSCIDAAFRGYDAALVLNIANGFWLPVLRAAGVPTVVNTDGVEWERGKWGRVARTVFRTGARWCARFADTLICDSEAIGRIWWTEFDKESEFIPYGADIPSHGPPSKLVDLGLARGGYILVVARLVPENNVDLTLDAVELLGDRAPRLVVVGSAGSESPIEDRLRRLEAGKNVMWLGHVSDQQLLTQLWQNAAAYVHGHSVGGTNPALLQALGAGAPTLALKTPFNMEVLPDPDCLYELSSRDLADKIDAVVGSEQRQRAMAVEGTAIVGERYSWTDVCAAYAAALTSARASRST
jgi:glycosyltransferase involved in cell wall biosynthesis